MTRGVESPERGLGSTVSAPRINTARLVLRPGQHSDRDGLLALRTDPLAMAHLGGPRPRAAVERALDQHPLGATPGSYVVADRVTDAFLGMTTLDRRDPQRPGHVVEGGGELELSYLLLPRSWGNGYATEATRAMLAVAADQLPDQPVVLVTQTANAASLRLAARLGFECVATFEEFGEVQALATAPLVSFAGAAGTQPGKVL